MKAMWKGLVRVAPWLRISRSAIRRWWNRRLLPPPCEASQRDYSMVLSMHDEPGRAKPALVDLAMRVGYRALDSRELGL
jgi:hypothetical protein